MNRIEMAQKLLENPKLRATNGKYEVYCDVCEDYGTSVIRRNDKHWMLTLSENGEDWEIIEPPKKLKQMSYGEVMWHYKNSIFVKFKSLQEIKSVETGRTFNVNDLTLEEYTGLWTIDGIYEGGEE